MTPTNRTEALALIRTKAIEANPEILELKFGCEIQRHDYKKGDTQVCIREPFIRSGFMFVDTYPNTGNPEIRNIEIIGRPVRLADVLLAIGGSGGEMRGLCLNTIGQMVILENKDGVAHKDSEVYDWNLRNDDLESQDDSTIEFLSGLLS